MQLLKTVQIKKTIDVIKKNINENLINILKKFKRSYTKNLSKNYYETKNFLSQHEIQVILAKKLVDSNLISKMLLSKKVFQELVGILGSDIEYQTDMELAINDKKSINDDYLVKFESIKLETPQFILKVLYILKKFEK